MHELTFRYLSLPTTCITPNLQGTVLDTLMTHLPAVIEYMFWAPTIPLIMAWLVARPTSNTTTTTRPLVCGVSLHIKILHVTLHNLKTPFLLCGLILALLLSCSHTIRDITISSYETQPKIVYLKFHGVLNCSNLVIH